MSEMVQRVMRAIVSAYPALGKEPVYAEHVARLAIHMLREPTATMVDAGEGVAHDDSCFDAPEAKKVYRAMIDEALK